MEGGTHHLKHAKAVAEPAELPRAAEPSQGQQILTNVSLTKPDVAGPEPPRACVSWG